MLSDVLPSSLQAAPCGTSKPVYHRALSLPCRREVDVMRSVNHPNLIKIFEVIEAQNKVGGR